MAIQRAEGQPIDGKQIFYFTQSVLAPLGSPALMPAHQTGGSMTLGGEMLDEQTKTGRILKKTSNEHNIELTQYFAPTDQSVQDTEEAQAEGRSQKIWRVIIDESVAETGEGEAKLYPAKFGYGKVGEISIEDGDELVEVTYEFNIVDSLKDGKFPLTDEDIAVINSLYEYQNPGDTTGDYDNIQTAESGQTNEAGQTT